jgi:hypothetical protein
MPDYAWDVLVYHDFSSSDLPEVGQPFPGFADELRVVAVTPPLHEGREAIVVLAFGTSSMPELESRLRGWGMLSE